MPGLWVVVLAALVSASCIAAALRRLVFVYEAVSFDPDTLLRELRGTEGRARAPALLAELVREAPEASDRDLYEALSDAGPDRVAHVVSALMELDFRFDRWARVPRVCASIASSAGFLLATWALRLALLDAPSVAEEHFRDALEQAIASALGVVAVGAVGTVACLSIFYEARRVARARRETTEKLVERLERIAEPDAPRAQEHESDDPT